MPRQGRGPAPPLRDSEDLMKDLDDRVSDSEDRMSDLSNLVDDSDDLMEDLDDRVSDNYAAEITHDALAQHGPAGLLPAIQAPSHTFAATSAPYYTFPMTATTIDASPAMTAPNNAFPAISMPTWYPMAASAASNTTSSTALQFAGIHTSAGPAGYEGILSMPPQVAPSMSIGPDAPATNASNAHGAIPQPIPTQTPASANSDPVAVTKLLTEFFNQLLVTLLALVASSGLSAAALLAALSSKVPPTTYVPVAAAKLMDKTRSDPRNHSALDENRSTMTKWITIVKEMPSLKRKHDQEAASACEITLSVLLEGPDKKPLAPAPLGNCLLSLTYVVDVYRPDEGGNMRPMDGNRKPESTTEYKLPVLAVAPVVELPVAIPRLKPVTGKKQVHVVLAVKLLSEGGEPVDVMGLPIDVLCESYRNNKRHNQATPDDKDVVSQMGDGTAPSPTAPAANPALADISESEVKDLCGAIERLDPVVQIMDTLQTRRAAAHMARVNVLKAAFRTHLTVGIPGAAAARPDVAWTAEHLGRVVAWVHNEDPAGPSVWTDTTILPLDFVAYQCHDPAWLRAIFDPPLATPTMQAAHTAALCTALKLPAADKWLPMHRAVFDGNVEFLIHAARIDTDHAIVALPGGFAGKTFLHLMAGRDDAAPVLRRLFADADFLPRDVWKKLLEAEDSYRVTPLYAALYKVQVCGRVAVSANVAALDKMEVAVGLQGVGVGEGEEGAAAPSI
ncbi:hypothetical protein AMAG_15136 [Allomyces macrogynus ATCC 38327]|uniref:Uncharacterized protein n=1 Tax=Allomyces macrogynus (strain ATCC 38327) TaxID=578462 RepID=A0A0L0T6I7_ALLM3|nr:hypothetical protein AMAG_15136 [Allomyces macrogynus ATCC 38327]|eukprot:KNE70164.1 hypothetical protein AMAG_15136 [Allomyces macrogynus ATCC 38327]